METYYLHTLMMFFKLQQATNYEAIRKVLAIMEDMSLPDHHTLPYIRHCLREAGLNETKHKNGRFEPSKENRERLDAYLQKSRPIITIDVQHSVFHLNLLSGSHMFSVILN